MRSILTSPEYNHWRIERLALSLLVFVLIAPILLLLASSGANLILTTRNESAWLETFAPLVSSHLVTSLTVVSCAIFTALVIGFIPAWITHHFEFKGRTLAAIFPLLSLTMTASTTASIYLETPFAGVVTHVIGYALLLGFSSAPLVYLFLRVQMKRISPSLFDAASSLGLSATRKFYRLEWPLLAPALLGAALLVLAESVSEVSAASRLGVSTFAVLTHNQWITLQDPQAGLGLSALVVVLVAILALPLGLLMFRNPLPQVATSLFEPRRQPLGGLRGVVAVMICVLISIPGFCLPAAMTARWAWEKFGRIRLETLLTDVLTTLVAASIVTLMALALVMLLTTLTETGERHSLRHRISALTLINYLPPALLVGIGFSQYVKINWLADSPAGTWLVLVFRFLPFLVFPVMESLSRVPASLFDAARSLGATRWSAFRKAVLPLLHPAYSVGAALVFLAVVNELTVSLYTRSFGYTTISMRIFNYTGVQMTRESSLWVLSSVLICLFPIWKIATYLNDSPNPGLPRHPAEASKGAHP